MYQVKSVNCARAVFTGILFFSFNADAVTLESTAGVDMRHTDNAILVSNNEVDELIVNTRVGAKIDAGSGPFQFNADTSLRYQHFTQDTYSDQQYFNLGALASWKMIKNRLDWNVEDFFSQQPIDSLDPATPDNIQDTNVLTFGLDIHFPISARQSITLLPEYQNFSYEIQNLDNQQNSLNASWSYQMFPTMNVELTGGVNSVDYVKETISDKTFKYVHFSVSRKLPRSVYSLKLGLTDAGRENSDSTRGLTGNVAWMLNLTGTSNLHVSISSEVTDSNRGLLNAARDPENADFSNQQISAEILRNSVARLTYNRADAKLKSSLWGELSEQDYDQALLDRDVQVVGAKFAYSVTPVVMVGIYTHYDHTVLTDISREIYLYSIGGNINYRLSRNLHSTIDLKRRNKDSTLDFEDFSEMSIFISLVYGYGKTTQDNNIGGGL